MSLVANKKARRKPDRKDAGMAELDRILGLRPSQRKRVGQLIELYHQAANRQEAAEIRDAIAEILHGEDYAATKIEDERSNDSGRALSRHRLYVAKQIRKHREKMKLSQQELASLAGIPQSHVSRLETGKHAPTYLTMEKLAKALRVKCSQLDPGFDD